MSKEAMKLALEALCDIIPANANIEEVRDKQSKAAAALREALAEQPAPAAPVQHKPTTYTERFTHAVAVLCGAQPPAEMVAEWFEDVEVNGGHRLQSWVGAQRGTPSWAQCIVVLDAAHVLANEPEEGEGHEDTPQAQPARLPLTDDELRSMCKQTWVFETVRQWARVIEAAHGIKENNT